MSPWRELEAVLFAASVPVKEEVLARSLKVSLLELSELLQRYGARLEADRRGFRLAQEAGGWCLVADPSLAPVVVEALGNPQSELSSASMETLAIVAYQQPIDRAGIEAIRGVRSERSLRHLEEEGLIEEMGRKEAPGRPILWGTTVEFLRRFGLQSLRDLPPLESFDHAAAALDKD